MSDLTDEDWPEVRRKLNNGTMLGVIAKWIGVAEAELAGFIRLQEDREAEQRRAAEQFRKEMRPSRRPPGEPTWDFACDNLNVRD